MYIIIEGNHKYNVTKMINFCFFRVNKTDILSRAPIIKKNLKNYGCHNGITIDGR